MQLTGRPSIRNTLTAITAVLIGGSVAHAADNTKLESSLLIYSETDRVKAAEGIVNLNRIFPDGHSLNGRFSFDALTGPSPNGALRSSSFQTFTRPSGTGSYTVSPGEIPMDQTFKDTRISFDGSYSKPLDRLTTVDAGGHLSIEHDYTSLGLNGGLSRDFNRKNTTLSVSSAISHDIVQPIGGAPVALSMMGAPSNGGGEDEFESEGSLGKGKNVLDAVLGLTQALDRKTLLRFNYSYNYSSGYLNDPYKILSLIQDNSTPNPGEPSGYIYEARPGSRSKQAVFGEIRRYFWGQVIDLSYRYFWDSWGIKSKTVDLHYRIPLLKNHALQPHARWYSQSAADFYHPYLISGNPLPTHASADYRLAPFHALTLGLEYFITVAPKTHLSISAEYYHQIGDISPPDAFGSLGQYDLFPEMKAIMVRTGLNYDF